MDANPVPPSLPAPSGLGRLPYLVIILILGGFTGWLGQTNSPSVVFAIFGWMIAIVILSAFRLKSIGWSAAFCLIGCIPYLNLLLAYALAVLPPGFATTRKLDSAGRIIATLLILGPFAYWQIWSYFQSN